MRKLFFALLFLLFPPGFIGAQENPHVMMIYECKTCHSTKDWQVVTFNHDTTNWSLEKEHQRVACINCHNVDDFGKARATCFSCHLDIHQGKLGKKCENCHTPAGWVVFDINRIHLKTTFPLIGAHVRLDCGACHYREIEGEFLRLNTDCIYCHKQEFLATKNPAHDEVGFSQRCEDCHSMVGWLPGAFNQHDSYFPISSGQHEGAWNTCKDCHIIVGDYKIFSCINCHEHNRDKMDKEHRGEVTGYVYESSACYSCHSMGGQ